MQTAIDKIRELRALHDDGILSRHEFDLRKNALLDALYAPAGSAPAAGGEARVASQGTEIGLMAGQEVGPRDRRYRLDRLIAYGGMGQVWQATDLATEAELGHSAQVALKILPPQLTRTASHARLLVEEATRARRLAHEHIVRVYEWAQDPATASYFIIMECLDGEDLDALLAREGPLPLERVLALLAPVADALDYAWERHGLVHRDIKPANVFVTDSGEVKLLDFGIAARARGMAPDAALEAPSVSGTAGYRAPEAGSPHLAPARTLDVFALAAMIHQLLTGAQPRAEGYERTRPEDITTRRWEVLGAALADDPSARPDSVRALLQALQAAAGPGEAELAEQEAARAEKLRRAREIAARKAAAQALAEQQARAAAEAALAQQRREQQKRERAAAEEARRQRKEVLRQQLMARRAEEVEKTRRAQEEARRKALQAKAVAAYLAQQKEQRQEQAQEQAQAPEPAGEGVPFVTPGRDGLAPEMSALLRDPFSDGSGTGPELVPIRAGRFQMGSPEHERAIAMAAGAQKTWLARETPQHWVGIERPVAMGRYPVTVGEWRRFAEATGWEPSGEVDWKAPGFAQDDSHPVVGVSWLDAQRYLRWLSVATGKRYRLPSEAEWEYACRAGTRTAFSFGDTIGTDQANYDGNFTYNGGARGEYRRGTTPVGSFPPNPWGLYDMHGNVWEWVQDVVHDNYEGAPLDGSAWETGGDQARRVLRGGSWLYNPRYLRSALRNGFSAVLSNDIVGFRVVRELG